MNTVILLAAGKSTRAGQNKLWADVQADPKGLLSKNVANSHNNIGQPLWTLSYQTFLEHPEIDRIVLVVPKGHELRFLPLVDGEKTTIISGGETRMESFKRGLLAIDFSDADILVDHNAANPNVTAREISEVISAASENGAAAVCHPVVDTLVSCEENSKSKNCTIGTIFERSNFRLMQTPQAVRGDILRTVELFETTDLSTALAKHTHVELLPAHPFNKKITTAEDLAALCTQTFLGEDSHRFSNEGQLTLGGLTIAELPKLEANSDGDVILHAIGRALAQAANETFSELADPLMLSGDTDSRDYIEPLLKNITVRHVSISIEGARPKIDPLKPALKESLAEILNLPTEQITIEAMTGEDLTPFGLGEGIRCTAIVQVLK